MEIVFKQFNIGNAIYLFCAEDFEIYNIPLTNDMENTIKKIRNKKKIEILKKKEKSTSYMDNKIKEFISDKDFITIIGLDISNGCTLNCTYCYISAAKKKIRAQTKDFFLDVLTFLENVKDKQLSFYFTGAGEPTLNFNLLQQIPQLCKEKGFHNCSFDLTTNGTILTKEMIDFFKLNKFSINISLDGNKEVHDMSRVFHNGKGSFDTVIKNINALKENDIEFSCKTVVQPNNNKLLNSFIFFEENKIPFQFSFSTKSFDNHFLPNIDDIQLFENQMELIIEYYKQRISENKKIYANKIIGDLKRIHDGSINKIACLAATESYFIDINGKIFTCSYHSSSEDLSIGDIYTGINAEKVINNEYYAKPVDCYLQCRECWMKHLCSGSCFAVKWLENKDTNKPSEYLCKTYNVYWTSIIRLYIQIYHIIISGNNINFTEKEIS